MPLFTLGRFFFNITEEAQIFGLLISTKNFYIKSLLFEKSVFFTFSDSLVGSVAVCAGSGASVLAGVAADLFVTGEMSHHEVLVTGVNLNIH
jgi:putative NIF3 family GTP cyclohydrolase 1 type 2